MSSNSYYTLCSDNRIIGTGGTWDDFAKDNDAPTAMGDKVKNLPLWDFISGFETQSFMNAVLFSCRQKQQMFTTKYRCDSPTQKRIFEMRVIPSENLDVRVEHINLTVDLHPVVSEIARYRCENRCSMCCRFRVGDEWIDAFTRPDQAFFPRSYILCRDCKTAATQGVETTFRNTTRIVNYPNRG